MLTHDELKKKILSNPDVKAEYDFLEEEFSLFDELLKARMNAGLTQAEVAERMGTKTVLSQALVKAKSALSSGITILLKP
jgi:plasmid maintenance system antidote protein VapI